MSVRQGFNIGEGSPEMGSWSLKLSPDAPAAWRDAAIRNGLFFDTLCITATRLRDPGVTRATILSKSIFSGYVERAAVGAMSEPWEMSGPSLVAWLGTPWPDWIIGLLIGAVVLAGAVRILRLR